VQYFKQEIVANLLLRLAVKKKLENPLTFGEEMGNCLAFCFFASRFWDGSVISWTICKQYAPCSRQITTPTPHHAIFLRAGCSSRRPTNSVKALKAILPDYFLFFVTVVAVELVVHRECLREVGSSAELVPCARNVTRWWHHIYNLGNTSAVHQRVHAMCTSVSRTHLLTYLIRHRHRCSLLTVDIVQMKHGSECDIQI